MKETYPQEGQKGCLHTSTPYASKKKQPLKETSLTILPKTLHLQVKGKAQPKKIQEGRRGRTPSQPPHDPNRFPQVAQGPDQKTSPTISPNYQRRTKQKRKSRAPEKGKDGALPFRNGKESSIRFLTPRYYWDQKGTFKREGGRKKKILPTATRRKF